jgi:hypothetical protein
MNLAADSDRELIESLGPPLPRIAIGGSFAHRARRVSFPCYKIVLIRSYEPIASGTLFPSI